MQTSALSQDHHGAVDALDVIQGVREAKGIVENPTSLSVSERAEEQNDFDALAPAALIWSTDGQ
jgi:hypothetical protein